MKVGLSLSKIPLLSYTETSEELELTKKNGFHPIDFVPSKSKIEWVCDFLPAYSQDKMDKVKVSSVRIAGHKIPYMVPHESEADEDEGTVSNHSSSR